MTDRPRLVLVGPPGSGKTTVGYLVAQALRLEFVDTDELIVAHAGKPIADIFVDDGEDRFRELERSTVAAALKHPGGVVALGGGAVLSEQTRHQLGGHVVCYLSVELADAVSRVGLGIGRPLLTINPRATLKYLLEQRRPLYQQVATFTVPTDGRSPDQVAAEVLAHLPTPPSASI